MMATNGPERTVSNQQIPNARLPGNFKGTRLCQVYDAGSKRRGRYIIIYGDIGFWSHDWSPDAGAWVGWPM